MKNAIKEETHKATKEKLVVSDKVLDDLVKGARKCCEDICNGTIHADNEISDVIEEHSAIINNLKQQYGRAMRSRNVAITYHPNFDIYLMTALVSSHNLEHQMVKGDVDYKTLALNLLRFFEYLDMSYSNGEEGKDE